MIPQDLAKSTLRRKQLRRQRRGRFLQLGLQMVIATSCAGGLLWAISQPIWLISQPEQIIVEGNQLMSEQAVISLLSLSYPQNLWHIQPQSLAHNLETKGPIAKATISRRLLPPSLTIQIQERQPVAIAINSQQSSSQIGWIDAQGVWVSLDSYSPTPNPRTQGRLPKLKVIGQLDQYRIYWPQFYQALSQTTIQITEVNWQDPGNIMLKTEIGTVYLGPYSVRLPLQFQVLERMRLLPQKVEAKKIAYIDIKNPNSPWLQLVSLRRNAEKGGPITPETGGQDKPIN